MSEKLKPCPFCGGGDINAYKPATSFGFSTMICTGCGAMVSFKGKRQLKDAAGVWNRRGSETYWQVRAEIFEAELMNWDGRCNLCKGCPDDAGGCRFTFKLDQLIGGEK